jgi:DNA-binding NtrC family response regulator
MVERPNISDTVPLSKGEGADASTPRISFVFYPRGAAKAVTISPGDSYVAGRSPPSEIELDDPSVSREHTRIRVLEDVSVEVEDLGSMNGTFVNGSRVEKARISAGDELRLGAVFVGVHLLEPGAKRLRGLESHDTFSSRFKEEIERARQFNRPLSILLIRAPVHVDELVSQLAPKLRRMDRSARYSDDIIEVMLPEMGPSGALAFAEALVKDTGLALGIGIATLPGGGRSAEELLSRARAAMPTKKVGIRSGDTEAARILANPEDALVINQQMQALYNTAGRAARSTLPVLVCGETGTGKEIVAREVHQRSPRAAKGFICVNCGALPSQLVESTLFGAEKGAFTGADVQRAGVFEAGSGGTVFLDEIGELPLAAQAALLRVLETGQITRVGGTEEIEVDVRIVAATHRDLEEMVEDGAFRKDLLFRLNAMTFQIPPLRERNDEILPLAHRFLREADRDLTFTSQAEELLHAYPWPGNIRELKNAVERAVVVTTEAAIGPFDLPDRVQRSGGSRHTPVLGGEMTHPDPAPSGDYRSQERDAQRKIILNALQAAGGNQSESARRLQMPLRTFVHKMKKLGIRRGDTGFIVTDEGT